MSKILIATPLYPPQIGGPAKYAKELHSVFSREGKSKVVAYGFFERILPPGLRHFLYFLRVCMHIGGTQAVLALDTWSVGVPALLATKLFRKRFVVRVSGDFLWESYVSRTKEMVKLSDFYAQPRRLSLKEKYILHSTNYLLKKSDAVAFSTSWQRELWAKAYTFDIAKTYIVENYYPSPSSETPTTARVFVAAGRDITLKNKKALNDAFAKVKEKRPDIALDERQLAPAEHLARVKKCYAVVVSSISEVNPNSAIEAAALRKPFIAPEDSGGKERLQGMGFFINPTVDSLTQAIEDLLDEVKYRVFVAASGSLKSHPWEEIASEYKALL